MMSANEFSLLSVMGSTVSEAPSERAATEADQLATANWRRNRLALGASQKDVLAEIESAGPIGLTWIFARDGSLTAQDESGQWWGKCSVPRATARNLTRAFTAKGTVQCYLDPMHAAELAVTMDCLASHQAMIAIVPDAWRLGVMLRCGDFSAALEGGRLWFFTGLNWERQLESLLDSLPGLPIPNQFVKTIFANEQTVGAMIDAAQGVFSRVTQRRGQKLEDLLADASTHESAADSSDVLVVAPSRFGLWGLAGIALERALVGKPSTTATGETDRSWKRLDPDQPASASPLALAMAAIECGAIVTADTGRSDLPGVVPMGCAWVTWITGPRVPARDVNAPRDAILLADAAWMDLALKAGWPKDRIGIAGWPVLCDECAGDRLGLIADVTEMLPPEAETNLSSQRLLWEFIRDELIRDPSACEGDPAVYLSARARKFAVDEESLNPARFFDELILPASAIGLARVLIANGLPVKIWGTGWDKRPEFAKVHGGAIRSMSELSAAAGECAAIVHAWPTTWSHPIDALGKPVIRRRGRGMDGLIRSARAAISGVAASAEPAATEKLSREGLMRRLLKA